MIKRPSPKHIVGILEKLTEHQGKTMLARIGQGNPFYTLVATILSARVRDEMIDQVLPEMMHRWPDVSSLARAKPGEIQQVIRQIGLYRIKSKRLVEVARVLLRDYAGEVPESLDDLVKLPGVGRKTAGCVVVYAFGGDALPVDTHVHRISNRLGWIDTSNPAASEKALYQVVPKKWWSRVNDLLVYHGKNTCLPRRPRCGLCPIAAKCPWPKAPKGGPGAARAAAHSVNWSKASLKGTISRIAGNNSVITRTAQKTIYTNPKSGLQVVIN